MKQTIISKNKITKRDSVRVTKNNVKLFKTEIAQYLDSNGFLSWSAKKKKYVILGTNTPKDGLVECPECKSGQLLVIKSHTTKKRFIGCTNYYNGCKASSPLLQKAMLKATKIKCNFCSWPTIFFRFSRKQKWQKQCGNIKCNSRKSKV
ncbi:MAG TPA: DNA topoisomerase [Candidatus Nitrosopelagicus sp.]|jgi:ssDNA-binding Zn-finger/Zn-ribbon topoisomerase 1|nr:DNA topoisomerase [Candidatus Nitrosopelagicus sp.]|tara:strand:+ start:891 stop:1337 length:447 start_codon:yes stop_codon:yes gene_type:complete